MSTRPLILDPAGRPVMSEERASQAEVQERRAMERTLLVTHEILLEAWGCVMGLDPRGQGFAADDEAVTQWRAKIAGDIRGLVGDRALEERYGIALRDTEGGGGAA